LDTNHSFSFANYHDPRHMGFRALRVINEDTVQPGGGFGSHPHQDMEIVSYVLGGALEHRDSLGNGSVIRPGEVQRMSAGTGIVHSEYNPSQSEAMHFFQIWIEPAETGLEPGYEQKTIDADKSRAGLVLIASPEGGEDAVLIHQDARIYCARLAAGDEIRHALAPGRHAWLQLAEGAVRLGTRRPQGDDDTASNGGSEIAMKDSDGAAVSGEEELVIIAERETELLLFDLA
jgi:redox-sensitive bicupin YhaK (pirin superfamily)